MLRTQITGTNVRQHWCRVPDIFSCRICVRPVFQRRTVIAKSALSPALQQKCDAWLALEADASRREQAQNWFASTEEAALQEALGQRLIFGGYQKSAKPPAWADAS